MERNRAGPMNKIFNSQRIVPPPEKIIWQDIYRFGLGLIMVPLGLLILFRAFQLHATSPGSVILGIIFIVFGIYRVYVGIVRYQLYRLREH